MENETIMLVEDEPMLLELLKSMLEEEGYRVVTAADGEEAVEIFRRKKNEIGVVLTDMGLPKLGGWEVFEKLHALDLNVKVILASGFVDSEMRERGNKKRGKRFYSKAVHSSGNCKTPSRSARLSLVCCSPGLNGFQKYLPFISQRMTSFRLHQ